MFSVNIFLSEKQLVNNVLKIIILLMKNCYTDTLMCNGNVPTSYFVKYVCLPTTAKDIVRRCHNTRLQLCPAQRGDIYSVSV